MKTRLTLYLTYSGPDANKESIKEVLELMVQHAADEGFLTGYLNLVVEKCDYEIHVKE